AYLRSARPRLALDRPLPAPRAGALSAEGFRRRDAAGHPAHLRPGVSAGGLRGAGLAGTAALARRDRLHGLRGPRILPAGSARLVDLHGRRDAVVDLV